MKTLFIFLILVINHLHVSSFLFFTFTVSPTVTVCPRSQLRSLESEAKLQCYAQGVPEPSKLWKKSETVLRTTEKLLIEGKNYTQFMLFYN